MLWDRKSYIWFYDNIHCHYYSLLMKFCFLPFLGEKEVRRELIAPVSFLPEDRILDMGYGTGGATFTIAEKAGEKAET
jgi:ubiquinone/menaquinone biosynthesis C-methylase UbiE